MSRHAMLVQRLTTLLAALLIAGALAATATAQTPPHVTVTPGTHATHSSAVTITLEWCFYGGIGMGEESRHIKLNSQDVSQYFTTTTDGWWLHPECEDGWQQSVGTVPLAQGINYLNAYVLTTGGYASTGGVAQYARPVPRHSMRVAAEIGAADIVVSTPGAQRFRIWNTGDASATYAIAASCTGGAAGGSCAPSSSSRTIAAGQSDTVSVPYTASAAAGAVGTVTLRAENTSTVGVSDSTWGDVRVVGTRPPVAIAGTFAGATIEKDQCLVFSIAADVASECGTLRVTHGMPAVRTVGKSRAPTLVYYVDETLAPRLPIDVTLPSGTPADSVELIVSEDVGGNPVIWRRTYAAGSFVAGKPMRLNGGLDSLFARGSGLYGFRAQVDRFSGGNRIALASPVTGEVAIVNRTVTVFGRGWWLAGLERLVLGQSGNRILWIGGDGSTRPFLPVSADVWAAPVVDRPDTLKLVAGRYLRTYPHGVKVYFDAQGRHDETIDRLGHSTRFVYRVDNSQALDRIELPPQSSGLSYRFTYDALWRLTSVLSPGATSDRPTIVYPGSAGIDSIVDPDSKTVKFRYAVPGSWMDRRTDRRGAQVDFVKENGSAGLASTSLTLAGGQMIQDAFRTPNGLGAGATDAAISSDSAHFRYDGPRIDVADVARFWLNGLGAPTRILNAEGRTTALEYANATFPGVATAVRGPGGIFSRASFNARGLPDSVVVEKPLGGTQNAKTVYQWHPTWESPTQVTSPTGVVTTSWYDGGTGNVDSLDTGGATRRVRFGYHSSGAAQGLVRWAKSPMAPAESLFYDALGNLRRTRSPIGFLSLSFADAIGRDTMAFSPIDSAAALDSASVRASGGWTRLTYDVMNQLTREVAYGPARSVPGRVIAADSVMLDHAYDNEGNRTLTSRWFREPGAPFGLLQDAWNYDLAGRVTKTTTPTGADSLERDPAGNVIRAITARGHSLTLTYDLLNRVSRRVVPEVVYGPHLCSSFRNPGTCDFSFPTIGTQVCIAADTARFEYDAAGNMIRADNGAAKIRRTYHPNGLTVGDSLRTRTYYSSFSTACEGPVRDGDRPLPVLSEFDHHVYGLAMTYDLDGRRTTLTHPSQLRPGSLAQAYSYNAATGELQWVKDVLGNQVSFAYDSAGRLSMTTFPGSVTDVRTYDADGRLIARNSDEYSHDAHGRVIAGTLGVAEQALGVWYSGLGAVVTASGRTAAAGEGGMEEFTTDGIGNRLWHRAHALHPEPGQNGERDLDISAGRLLSIRSRPNPPYTFNFAEDYAYDAAGNVDLTYGSTQTSSSLTYDQAKNYYAADQKLRARNRHVGSWMPSEPGGAFEEYRYDALGRRVLVRSRATGAFAQYFPTSCAAECLKSYVERTVWDGDQVLYEMRGLGADSVSGQTLEEDLMSSTTVQEDRFGRIGYTHGLGIDQPVLLARMGLASGPNVILAPHPDWQGQFTVGTYMNGTSCGNPTCPVDWPASRLTVDGAQTTPAPSPRWFGNLITQKMDGSGLQYMRNRYYDPKTGRFTQEDPIGLVGGLNVYGFADGDPVNFSDPFGLCPPCRRRPLRVGIFAGAALNAVGQAGREYGDDIAVEVGLALMTGGGGNILFHGSKAALKQILRFDHLVGATGRQGLKLLEKLRAAADEVLVEKGEAGDLIATLARKFDDGGMRQVVHTIDAAGNTTRVVERIMDKSGKVVSETVRFAQ